MSTSTLRPLFLGAVALATAAGLGFASPAPAERTTGMITGHLRGGGQPVADASISILGQSVQYTRSPKLASLVHTGDRRPSRGHSGTEATPIAEMPGGTHQDRQHPRVTSSGEGNI